MLTFFLLNQRADGDVGCQRTTPKYFAIFLRRRRVGRSHVLALTLFSPIFRDVAVSAEFCDPVEILTIFSRGEMTFALFLLLTVFYENKKLKTLLLFSL
jgi:hypothetical protein